jgi:tetratricopeptide (TPR) repeat protein
MLKRTLFTFAIAAFFVSCGEVGDDKKELTPSDRQQSIKQLENFLYTSDITMFNDSAAKAVVEAYEAYYSLFPEDPLTPDYLFKAGEVSLGLNQPLKSMSFFKKVYDYYPNFEKAPYSLFLQAYVLDNHLNDDNRAGEVYQEFISKFPEHPMVKDAEFSIKNLGKTDEDLIKEFEENLRKQQGA